MATGGGSGGGGAHLSGTLRSVTARPLSRNSTFVRLEAVSQRKLVIREHKVIVLRLEHHAVDEHVLVGQQHARQ